MLQWHKQKRKRWRSREDSKLLLLSFCSNTLCSVVALVTHSSYLYTIIEHTVTANDPRLFLESKSSEGEMRLLRGLTCHTTHQWRHPPRIQRVYSYLYVTKIRCVKKCFKMNRLNWWLLSITLKIIYLEQLFPSQRFAGNNDTLVVACCSLGCNASLPQVYIATMVLMKLQNSRKNG